MDPGFFVFKTLKLRGNTHVASTLFLIKRPIPGLTRQIRWGKHGNINDVSFFYFLLLDSPRLLHWGLLISDNIQYNNSVLEFCAMLFEKLFLNQLYFLLLVWLHPPQFFFETHPTATTATGVLPIYQISFDLFLRPL